MDSIKLSVAEIIKIADLAKEQGIDSGLPRSKPGVADRAKRQGWKFELTHARGGKNGVKKVYILPNDVVEELRQKGVLRLINTPTQPIAPEPPPQVPHSLPDIPDFMLSMVATYHDWAKQQNTNTIIPIRYHTNVFGSAGNGYTLDELPTTEAMWFRASFFEYLKIQPERCFCTRVRGDSMHPTLIDRGTVLWKMQNAYTTEGIYLFRQVNELRIKRLQRINSHTFRIISDNSNKDIYPTESLDLRDMESHEFEIYGRYLWDCAIRP